MVHLHCMFKDCRQEKSADHIKRGIVRRTPQSITKNPRQLSRAARVLACGGHCTSARLKEPHSGYDMFTNKGMGYQEWSYLINRDS